MKIQILIIAFQFLTMVSYARETSKECSSGTGEFCAQYECLGIVSNYKESSDSMDANDYRGIMPKKEYGIGNLTLLSSDQSNYYIITRDRLAAVAKDKLKEDKRILYPLDNFGSTRALPSGRKKSIDAVAISTDPGRNELVGEEISSKEAKEEFDRPQIYTKDTASSKIVAVKIKVEEDLSNRIKEGLKKIMDYDSAEVKALSTATIKNLADDLIQCQKGLERQQVGRSEEDKKFLLEADSALNQFIAQAKEIVSYRRDGGIARQRGSGRIAPARKAN